MQHRETAKELPVKYTDELKRLGLKKGNLIFHILVKKSFHL